jgi:hypothetical protein
MAKVSEPIRFDATVLRPAGPKGAAWAFLVLPAAASARLPTRSMIAVEGAVAGHPFKATLEPDGKGSHWLKLGAALLKAAAIGVGDRVELQMGPAATQPEPRLPAELKSALSAAPEAARQWRQLTPVARRDWIAWITTARKAETRERRIATACSMLAAGKRRICCFDRSGIYGGNFAAPEPAD